MVAWAYKGGMNWKRLYDGFCEFFTKLIIIGLVLLALFVVGHFLTKYW